MTLRIIFISLLFLVFPQDSKDILSIVKEEFSNGKFSDAELIIKNIKPTSLKSNSLAQYYFLYAEIKDALNKEHDAFNYYIKAKKKYLEIDSIEKAMLVNLKIAQLIYAQEDNPNNHKKYIDEFLLYARKRNDPQLLSKAYVSLGNSQSDEKQYYKALKSYTTAQQYNKVVADPYQTSVINNNIANLYNEVFNKPDSALYYLNLDLKYLKKQNNPDALYHNYLNQASSYYHKGDFATSILFLKKADSLPIKMYPLKSKQYIYEGFRENYVSMNDFENAYKYTILAKKFADSTNTIEQNIAINDIQTKYQTAEKELENLRLKGFLYTFLGLLVISILIGWLIIKNSRRKEKILKQEKLIEQQKLEKALKDYELSSIDMMLEGQEKERQRLANDLHDNLGSMLATLKLNFENLKLRKNELRDEENKLYERTDELIEEAYQKVRRIAHAKNAGVFANEGLIPALQKLAEKISIPGKLTIEVIPFGFNERIENTIEIAIFRMIQELATNIIKHSQATEAAIHLTKHDDNINIIVEDNGNGLDSEAMAKSDGMGITAIQKKCEQLGGAMTIDAAPGKGTTIIIDIPV
jgi:signal transduction histidine kinase